MVVRAVGGVVGVALAKCLVDCVDGGLWLWFMGEGAVDAVSAGVVEGVVATKA